jgi:hypothetical protein
VGLRGERSKNTVGAGYLGSFICRCVLFSGYPAFSFLLKRLAGWFSKAPRRSKSVEQGFKRRVGSD